MTVRLVAAGGPRDGRGHVARALALGEALVAQGFETTLELRRGRLTDRQAAYVAELGIRSERTQSHAARVRAGVTRHVDTADVTVVDLPDPNTSIDIAGSTVVFDDRDRFRGKASIVVQPSLPAWTGASGGRGGRVLAGYDYYPIAPAMRERGARAAASAPDQDPDPYVVVCFGGSDPADVTARLAPALGGIGGARTVVVVGPGYRGSVAESDLEIRKDPADLSDLLAGAALVIVGAGTMKFELALLGRPMILVGVADDQLAVGPPFAATGAARYLGDGRLIDPADVRDAAVALLGDDAARTVLGERGRSMIDGRGADRIAEAIAGLVGAT